jgi:hypothetical protein
VAVTITIAMELVARVYDALNRGGVPHQPAHFYFVSLSVKMLENPTPSEAARLRNKLKKKRDTTKQIDAKQNWSSLKLVLLGLALCRR